MSIPALEKHQPDRFTRALIDTCAIDVVAKYLGAAEILNLIRIDWSSSKDCRITRPHLSELLYRDRLLNQLLPGIKEEQLPRNLISYKPKAKEVAWEVTYNTISKVVYGPAFFKSIGITPVDPAGPIPEYLFERKYLPTHTVEIAANSTLGLTKEGKLTYGPQDPENPDDPEHYAPQNHRYDRPRPVEGAVGLRTLEFPNTEYNRDFLEANPYLKVAPYPMQSPLEQGSPLLLFQTDLKIDVPEESPLRATPEGVLTEKPGPTEQSVNGKRTVRFLNTPHNWLMLAKPVLTIPTRNQGPDSHCFAKYLSVHAKPVGTKFNNSISAICDIPVSSGWKAPTANLVALGGKLEEQVAEAEALGQHAMTFGEESIHRILTQIRGNPDPYPKLFSRTTTNLIGSTGGEIHRAGTFMFPATPFSRALVLLTHLTTTPKVGLAAAWSQS